MARLIVLSAALVVAVSVPALAQKPATESGTVVSTTPGKGTVTNVAKVTATVEAIDTAARTVTLKGPSGSVTLAVGPEAKNFDRIKVGDLVVAQYTEALTLELKKGGTAIRSRTESDTAAVARPGARPGRTVGRQTTVVADVIAVDRQKQVVTLRGPNRVVDLKLGDPEQIKLINVGDQVEATYTEAVALSVEPAPKPAPKK